LLCFVVQVECFPFEDHNAPPFELIALFCQVRSVPLAVHQ
jgi:hypothetical protein